MILNQRQQALLTRVKRDGHASVEKLAVYFDVTPQTIRRDINQLADASLLLRVHGGASTLSSVENVAYDTRQIMLSNEKKRIAECLVLQIPNQASLFISLGTSTEAVADALRHHTGLRIITNNLNVASMMCAYTDCEVIVAGGIMRPRDKGIIGEATIEFIKKFRVDYAIIGTSSIEIDGTLRDFDLREVRITEAIIQQSRHVFLVADHSKFNRPALVQSGHLSQMKALFTDQSVSPDIERILNENGTELYIAN